MKSNKPIQYFRKIFFHPRPFIFILTGTAIIFLIFLTDNNAIEIAISGIASVFIGVGVNNLSSFEMQAKDEMKYKSKISNSIKIMTIAKDKIERLKHVAFA